MMCLHATYGAQSSPSITQKKGLTSDVQSRKDEDPSRAGYRFFRGCELSCTTRSGVGRKGRTAQAPRAGPVNRHE